VESVKEYLTAVPADVALLLSHFRITDLALRVVGVGSVGTRCYLMRSRAAILYECGRPWSARLLLDEMITGRYALDNIDNAYAALTAGRLIRRVVNFGLG
jgi:Uncharacterized protein conserved in bacteria (DUF2252)